MMHVCLHENFSVNYASIFAVHQKRVKSLGDRGMGVTRQ